MPTRSSRLGARTRAQPAIDKAKVPLKNKLLRTVHPSQAQSPNPKPGFLVGRQAPLLYALALINEAMTNASPRAIRITAPAGHGKSAFLDELATRLSSTEESIVFRATAAFASGDGDVLVDLLKSQSTKIRNQRASYISGLESLFDGTIASRDHLRLGLIRLIEALAEDVPVHILVDDAQWCDTDSLDAIVSLVSLPQRKVAIVFATRPSSIHPKMIIDELALGSLDAQSSADLVRRYYPTVSDAVSDAIARVCAGVPLDLVMLSSQAALGSFTDPAQLHSTLAETIAGDVAQMPPESSELLQACALLDEPVNYRVLSTTFGESTTPNGLIRLIPRYLAQGEGGLVFTHALVREAVLGTIKLPANLQTRLLNAIDDVDAPTEELLVTAANFARATGDTKRIVQKSLLLADLARANKHWHVAADAYEAAFGCVPRPRADYIEHYTRYVEILRLLERDDDARLFLEPLLAELSQKGMPAGLCVLAGVLANVLFQLNEYERALSVCNRYASATESVHDKAELESVSLSLQVHNGNAQLIDDNRFEGLLNSAPPSAIERRLRIARVLVNVQRGISEAVTSDLAGLTAQIGRASDIQFPYLLDLHRIWTWHKDGARVRDSLLESLAYGSASLAYHLSFLTYVDFACGHWPVALARVHDFQIQRFSTYDLDAVLIPCAAILALGGTDDGIEQIVKRRARDLLAQGTVTAAGELVLWYLASPQTEAASPEAIIFAKKWLAMPPQMTWHRPAAIVAAFFSDRYPEWSDLQAQPTWAASRLNRAALDFRSGWRTRERAPLERAEEAFRRLGADSLAMLARGRLHGAEVRLDKAPRDHLTPREQEVCLLLAEGLTNRAIAQRLFISERTVATHVSSSLAKVGARTRTELARLLAD
ncbi:MAG: LuxR C-terminal-related transcriptional regulator [Candidatus Baltobacteraceae bacterium]